jgi:hypothetical protein
MKDTKKHDTGYAQFPQDRVNTVLPVSQIIPETRYKNHSALADAIMQAIIQPILSFGCPNVLISHFVLFLTLLRLELKETTHQINKFATGSAT